VELLLRTLNVVSHQGQHHSTKPLGNHTSTWCHSFWNSLTQTVGVRTSFDCREAIEHPESQKFLTKDGTVFGAPYMSINDVSRFRVGGFLSHPPGPLESIHSLGRNGLGPANRGPITIRTFAHE
jgi:hypothetical protein